MASEISTDPIDEFKSWALKLGCPVNALPNDVALRRLMKQNHANVQELMEIVRPKSEVKLCRANLLLASLSDSNALERHQTDLPNNLKNLKQKEKLNRQIDELKPRVERLTREFKDKQSSLFEKAEQLKELRKTHRSTKSKSIQLEQKHAQLMEKIEVEKGFEAMLADGFISVPIVRSTADDKIKAGKAVTKSLLYLRNVYKGIGDDEITKTDREKVQREIKKAMAGIPVVSVFEAIQCGRKMNTAQFNSNCQPCVSVPSAFDVAITKSSMRTYIDHHLATKKMTDEHSARVEQYVQLYDQYLAEIVNKMRCYNGPDVELFAESMCGDYLKQYGTSLCNQAMLQFMQQKLSILQQRATERDDRLKGNELIAAELLDMYQFIEKAYNSAYDDIVSLGDTNKSLKQLLALSVYTINSFGHRSISNSAISLLNGTLGSMVLPLKLVPAEYKNELSVLFDLMHEQWNHLPVPISMDIECQRSNEAISPFYSLLTPNAALKELKLKWEWYKVIDTLTQTLDDDRPVAQVVDVQLIAQILETETTKMEKLLEDVKFMYQTGNVTVSDIEKYLEFLLNKSLGSFIPDRVMINRRHFRDYEEEFLCACSMLSNSVKRN